MQNILEHKFQLCIFSIRQEISTHGFEHWILSALFILQKNIVGSFFRKNPNKMSDDAKIKDHKLWPTTPLMNSKKQQIMHHYQLKLKLNWHKVIICRRVLPRVQSLNFWQRSTPLNNTQIWIRKKTKKGINVCQISKCLMGRLLLDYWSSKPFWREAKILKNKNTANPKTDRPPKKWRD